MNAEDLQHWLERKCAEEGCYNYRVNGYIYCHGHLWGFPARLPDVIIEALKESEK